MHDERTLLDKLAKIMALHEGADTLGEREAAEAALHRIQHRLEQARGKAEAIEMQFSIHNAWSQRLFIALLRKHGLRPYRYPRQRRQTIMAKMERSFCDHVLWPEFEALNEVLTKWLDELAGHIIGQAIHDDGSDAEIVAALPHITAGH